jgi:hypothetical protein
VKRHYIFEITDLLINSNLKWWFFSSKTITFFFIYSQNPPKTPHINININVEIYTEQWEKDLEAELQDYEVVNDGTDKTNWEKDVDELLDDEDDLK